MTPTASCKRPAKVALTPEQRRQRAQLLDNLTYELNEGKPIYYAGYDKVVRGQKEADQIIGSSYLQGTIINLLLRFLYKHPLEINFKILTNEIGVQLKKHSWRSCDIAIYEKERLAGVPITDKYMPIPPDYVIEIDTKADLSKYLYQHEYFIEKTRQLHEFGVKRVIWIFTKNIPVIWESETADTIVIHNGWDYEVTITEGMAFNLEQLVQAEQA